MSAPQRKTVAPALETAHVRSIGQVRDSLLRRPHIGDADEWPRDLFEHYSDRASTILWGACFNDFLNWYNLEHDEVATRPRRSDVTAWLNILFEEDESVIRMVRYVMRCHLEQQTPVSLTDVAMTVISPTKVNNFSRFRRGVSGRVMPALRSLGVWKYDVALLPGENGLTHVRGYEIDAGPALVMFDTEIYHPARELHNKARVALYMNPHANTAQEARKEK